MMVRAEIAGVRQTQPLSLTAGLLEPYDEDDV